MCYIHLRDECSTCDSYKSRYGKYPDFIEWTDNFIHGNNRPTPYDKNGEYLPDMNKSCKEIRIFGIKIGEIS